MTAPYKAPELYHPDEFITLKKPNYGANEEQIRQYAMASNQSIVFASPDQVQVDIDSATLPESFELVMGLINRKASVHKYVIEVSHSGNRHVTVTFNRAITNEEALLFEAVLGGDPKRVMLRFIEGNDSFLFQPMRRRPEDHPITVMYTAEGKE